VKEFFFAPFFLLPSPFLWGLEQQREKKGRTIDYDSLVLTSVRHKTTRNARARTRDRFGINSNEWRMVTGVCVSTVDIFHCRSVLYKSIDSAQHM
jgi:hypothetical protein